MSPVGITMLMSRRYLFIAGTRTLLEIPGTVAGVDGMRRLRWNRRTIQSETSHSLSSEFHLLRGRFLVTQHPLNDLSAEIHLSVQLLLIVINHPTLANKRSTLFIRVSQLASSRCSAAAIASNKSWDCTEGLGGTVMNHPKSNRGKRKYRNQAP